MAILTRYTTSPTTSGFPVLAWETGLNPNRRWVPASLPADEADISSWASQYADSSLTLGLHDVAKPLTVDTESSVKYAYSSGAAGEGLALYGISPATMRTVVIIARANTGDDFNASPRIARFGDTGAIQKSTSNDTATCTANVSSLAAARDKWHVYAVSLPALESESDGVFVVDENSTTMPYSDAAWDMSSIEIASSSGSTGRELRILEVITSADTFSAGELTALYDKAVAWYPGLTWT